jgi:putative DNA methylase
MNQYPKRLIEVDLPIREISRHARREKSIRHGHISTLHVWWARRPLAACRAVICAALWPDPADVWCPPAFRKAVARVLPGFAEQVRTSRELAELSQVGWPRWNRLTEASWQMDHVGSWADMRYALLDFIADFANWDADSVPAFLEASRELTQAAHEALGGMPGTRPLVVDPFAGGGAIPQEALRVGADAFASDLNPVAVLLNKVVLEYIPKHGQRLADEVSRWGEWLVTRTEESVRQYYPQDFDNTKPIAYLWARTITCEGPSCGAEVPLIRSLWLSKNRDKQVVLKIHADNTESRVVLDVAELRKGEAVGEGTVSRGAAVCPVCGYTTPAANVRAQFKGRKGGASDARLLAVARIHPDEPGKDFRSPTDADYDVFNSAQRNLESLLADEPDWYPQERLPYLRSIFNIHLLDVKHWGDLFNARQMLSLIIMMRHMKELSLQLEDEISVAVLTCLGFAIDRVAAQFSSLSWWQPGGEFVVGTFGRQALGIIWDYAEIRPVNGASGDLNGAIEWIARVISNQARSIVSVGIASKGSATNQPLPDDSAQAFITDPPYYDAVPYADLADFFFVLLKRMLGSVHPDILSGELSPKRG